MLPSVTLPQAVSSLVLGVVSPLAMVTLLPVTLMSGAGIRFRKAR